MAGGSCLCRKVQYQILTELIEVTHCHCVTCRKAHASAFSSVAMIDVDEFSLMGEEHLSSYESSPGKHRYFCSSCGSQIYAKRDNKHYIVLRLGTLDEPIDNREKEHIWVSEKAHWYSLERSLPMKPEF
ncbi:GFA family protein [Pseudoteredinibacter isoporae]|uniref:GFA family protein n=1 Tax=Pseudoteredinibacter isoporae TaxID=570281 RepID=UPI00310B61B3